MNKIASILLIGIWPLMGAADRSCMVDPVTQQIQGNCTEREFWSLNSSMDGRGRKGSDGRFGENAAGGERDAENLEVISGPCDQAGTISRGNSIMRVVPFRYKQIECGDPTTTGWNIVGMGAREIEVEECRFYIQE